MNSIWCVTSKPSGLWGSVQRATPRQGIHCGEPGISGGAWRLRELVNIVVFLCLNLLSSTKIRQNQTLSEPNSMSSWCWRGRHSVWSLSIYSESVLVIIFRDKLGGVGKIISGTTSDQPPLPGTEGSVKETESGEWDHSTPWRSLTCSCLHGPKVGSESQKIHSH